MTTGAELDKKIDHQRRLIEILAKLVARAWVITTTQDYDSDEETETDFKSWRLLVSQVWKSGVSIGHGFGPDIVADAERWEKEFERKVLEQMGLGE